MRVTAEVPAGHRALVLVGGSSSLGGPKAARPRMPASRSVLCAVRFQLLYPLLQRVDFLAAVRGFLGADVWTAYPASPQLLSRSPAAIFFRDAVSSSLRRWLLTLRAEQRCVSSRCPRGRTGERLRLPVHAGPCSYIVRDCPARGMCCPGLRYQIAAPHSPGRAHPALVDLPTFVMPRVTASAVCSYAHAAVRIARSYATYAAANRALAASCGSSALLEEARLPSCRP